MIAKCNFESIYLTIAVEVQWLLWAPRQAPNFKGQILNYRPSFPFNLRVLGLIRQSNTKGQE